MQIVSSYGVEIKKKNIPLRSTLDIFRKAVSYLIPVYAETWEELSEIRNPQKRFNEAEHLVHETKKNHARFLFDRHFPKMPSYLRRAAIQHALGAVSSYQTRLSLWEKGELRGKPKLACDGSGAVVRNQENHSLCTFRTGKQYNCDLSASYNIGARYFIRELLKPLPGTGRSSLEAKVPAVKRRTSCVYADLRKLYVEVNNLKAA